MATGDKLGVVMQSDVAGVEIGSTATQSHLKGSYFYFAGKLCRATEKIQVGDTLDYNTLGSANCRVVGICSEIEETMLIANSALDGASSVIPAFYTNNDETGAIDDYGNITFLTTRVHKAEEYFTVKTQTPMRAVVILAIEDIASGTRLTLGESSSIGPAQLPDDLQRVKASFAPLFSASNTYAVGDYVMHNSKLYRCTRVHHEDWDDDDFTEVKACADLKELLDGVKNTEAIYRDLEARALSDTEKYTVAGSIEKSSTAQYAHAKDSYFLIRTEVSDGPPSTEKRYAYRLERAIAAISVGDTITDSNSASVTLTEELDGKQDALAAGKAAVDKTVYEAGDDYFPTRALSGITAPVELTTTASQAYSAGDHLIRALSAMSPVQLPDGSYTTPKSYVLYTATAAIAQGDTLADYGPGMNIRRAMLGEELGNACSSLAPEYNESSTYAVGAYCTQKGALYRCTTAITTPEDWTAAHWTAVSVGGDIASYLPTQFAPAGYGLGGISRQIAATDNIDNLTDGGFYYCSSTAAASVAGTTPFGSSGFGMLVMPMGTGSTPAAAQIAVKYISGSGTGTEIKLRFVRSGAPLAWQTIALT